MRAMAASRRIHAEVGKLARGEGMLVRCAGLGLATIDHRVAEEGGFPFALAHEIGHDVMDPDFCDFESCVLSRGKKAGRRQAEVHANDFASEVAMPESMFVPFLARLGGAPGFTIEHVFEAAHAFRMPDDAIAIRMLLFTALPCAAVCSVAGRVKWWVRNEHFPTRIPWGGRVPEASYAARLHRGGGTIRRSGQSIASGAWDRTEGTREIREQAVRLTRADTVLTWLVDIDEKMDR